MKIRPVALALILILACAALPTSSLAQGRGGGGRGGGGTAAPRPAPVVHGEVFIGGYFYDPAHGRYPWWPRPVYPYRYFPVYDQRALVRIIDAPRQAAVYVDGFYAGDADDFDGLFQRLPLTPGGHEIVLYLRGYRTMRFHIYLGPGSRMTMHGAMQPMPWSEASEAPPLAPPIPPPPPGTYRQPRHPADEPRVTAPVTAGEDIGTLDLRVQPAGARITIDGQFWRSSDLRHLVVDLPAGTHHVTIAVDGYQTYTGTVVVHDGETTALNISLMKATGGATSAR